MSFVTILIALCIFSLIILVHELGHFLAAKRFGIYVEDFSLGMGPKLLQYKGKETTYTLRPVPFGGWCKMRGEDQESDDPRSFKSKKVWQQMWVIFSGPLMNFVLAIIVFIILFMMMGTPSNQNVVGETFIDSPAEAAGLQEGDAIIEINGNPIGDWGDISEAVNTYVADEPINLVIERDGVELEKTIIPYFNEEANSLMIGISPMIERQNIFAAIGLGFQQTVDVTILFVQSIWQMIIGEIEAEVAGPVGIVVLVGDAAQGGIQQILFFIALISINLGFINLLPLPALDGGRLVFLTLEAIRGKPVSQSVEGMIHFVGFVLLIGLLIVITFNDITRLIGG